jgi:hypothetical protein
VSFTTSSAASVSAILSVTSPASVDNDKVFAVPISGTASAATHLSIKNTVQVAYVHWTWVSDEAILQTGLVRFDQFDFASKVFLW